MDYAVEFTKGRLRLVNLIGLVHALKQFRAILAPVKFTCNFIFMFDDVKSQRAVIGGFFLMFFKSLSMTPVRKSKGPFGSSF